jgi:magnesium transporter
MDDSEILVATQGLQADKLAELAPDLSPSLVQKIIEKLDVRQRERVRSSLSYKEDEVGAIMDFELITIKEDITLEVVFGYLRHLKDLPNHTDKLFVTDYYGILKGVLPFNKLLVNDVHKTVSSVMISDPIFFEAHSNAIEAANAFERYDLISAPVIEPSGQLIGRLTIDDMVDVIREEAETDSLNRVGLEEEEDIFAPVLKSLQNRWFWLFVNLITAFVASRVIVLFEDSISQLVVLASLMPIVAGIGGNSGNQTITMIVRGLALGELSIANARWLLLKELKVAFANGLIWGGLIGCIILLYYGDLHLGLVMTCAMTLNLLLAAFMGVLIPMAMSKFGRDPAIGSSVMITALTDSGGFFLFLGLANLFLI